MAQIQQHYKILVGVYLRAGDVSNAMDVIENQAHFSKAGEKSFDRFLDPWNQAETASITMISEITVYILELIVFF